MQSAAEWISCRLRQTTSFSSSFLFFPLASVPGSTSGKLEMKIATSQQSNFWLLEVEEWIRGWLWPNETAKRVEPQSGLSSHSPRYRFLLGNKKLTINSKKAQPCHLVIRSSVLLSPNPATEFFEVSLGQRVHPLRWWTHIRHPSNQTGPSSLRRIFCLCHCHSLNVTVSPLAVT